MKKDILIIIVSTLLSVSASGQQFEVLHNFLWDPAYPEAPLVQGQDGSFYGTTSDGGIDRGGPGAGTIYKIDASGALTILHMFTGPDGFIPLAELIQGTDGNFYGTTSAGGANGYGTVFKMDAAGNIT